MDLNPNQVRNHHKSKVIQYHQKLSSKASMIHSLNQQLELIPQTPFYQSPQIKPRISKKNSNKKKTKKQPQSCTPQLRNSEQKIALNPSKEEHYNKLKFYGKGHIDASRGSLKCPLCQKQLKVYRFNFHKCEECQSYMHLKCYSKLANKESRVCCKQNQKKKLKEEKQEKKSQKVFSNMKTIRKKLWKMRNKTIAQQIRENNLQLNLDQSNKEIPRLYPQLANYISVNSNSKILRFPISDQLFWKYEFLNKYVPSNQLPELVMKPAYFGDLLEMWNMYSSIPLFFKKWSHYSFQSFSSKVLGQSFTQMLCPLLILHLQAINSVFSRLMRKQATIDDPNIKSYRNHRFQRLLKTLLFTNRYQQLEVIIKIKRFFLKVVLEILKAHPLCQSIKSQIKSQDKTKLQYMCIYDYILSPQARDRQDMVEKLRQKQIRIITKVLSHDPEKQTQKQAEHMQIEQYQKYYYEEKYESKFEDVNTKQDNIKEEEQEIGIVNYFDCTINKSQLIQLLLVYIHSKVSFRKIVKEYRNAEIEEWKRYKLVYEKYYKNQKERAFLDSQLKTNQQILEELEKQLKGLKNKQLLMHKTKQTLQLAKNISQNQDKLSSLVHQQTQIEHLLTQHEKNYDEKSDAKVYEFQLTHKLKFLGKISPPQVKADTNFWKIQSMPDKIFVCSNRIWGYYASDQVDQILQCINIRAKSQYKLYRNLLTFKFKGNPSQICAAEDIEQVESQQQHSEIYKYVDKIKDIQLRDILPLVTVTFKAISQKNYFRISQKQAQKCLKKIEQKIRNVRTHKQCLGVFKETFAILQRYILKNQHIKIWAYQSVKGDWNIRFNYSMSLNQRYLLVIIFCLKIDKIQRLNISKCRTSSHCKLEQLEPNEQQQNQQQGLYDYKYEDQEQSDFLEFDEEEQKGKRFLEEMEDQDEKEEESPYKKRLTENQWEKYDYLESDDNSQDYCRRKKL